MNDMLKRDLIDSLFGLGGPTDTSTASTPILTPPPPRPTDKPPHNIFSDIGSVISDAGSAVSSILSSVTPVSTSSQILSSSSSPIVSPSSSASSASSISSSSSSLISSSVSSSTSTSTSSSTSSTSSSTSSSQFSTYVSSSDGQYVTVTSFVNAVPSPSTSSAAPHPQSFLQNKPLSGTIFALVGLIVVIIIVVIITTCTRRRRRDRLLKDAAALSFDPNDVEARFSDEKLYRMGSHSGHGHDNFSDPIDYTPAALPNTAYIRQDYGGGHGLVNPGHNMMPNPYATYGNPVYQQTRSPSPMYGGAAAGIGDTVAYAGPQRSVSNSSANDMTSHRIPSPGPLPDMFGNDVYGGITSIDTLNANTTNSDIPRSLRVANK